MELFGLRVRPVKGGEGASGFYGSCGEKVDLFLREIAKLVGKLG